MNGSLRRWATKPEIVDRLTPAVAKLAFGKYRKGRVVRCVSYLIGRLYGIGHLFDASWYRKRYPDIAAAGVDPLLHYLSHGWRERRDPSPNFSTSAYLAAHPLVEKSRTNPLVHFVLTRERRSGQALDPSSSAGGGPAGVDRNRWQRRRPKRPGLLFLIHDHGGGTARFAAELAEHIYDLADVVFMRGRGNLVELSHNERGEGAVTYALPDELDLLCQKVRRLNMRRITILHTLTIHEQLVPLLDKLQLPFDFVALDYFSVMAQPHLAKPDGTFFGDRNLPVPVWEKDQNRRAVIERSERFIACSDDLAQRLHRLGVRRQIVVAPPPEPHAPNRFRCWPRPIRDTEMVRVMTIGAIRPNKGRDVIIEAADLAKARGLPIEFHVYGDVLPAAPPSMERLHIHDEKSDGPLTVAICRIWPHLAWFPFQVPETHSYALSDAMSHGLPILASDIGAVSSRLAGRDHTWLAPWDLPASEWLEQLMRLRDVGFSCSGAAGPVQEGGTSFYRDDFVKPLAG